jgi:hypothetical protein
LAPITILLPPTAATLAGDGVFTPLSITKDIRTRPPSRMATAEAVADQADLLIILCYFQFLLNFALPPPPAASYELLMERCNYASAKATSLSTCTIYCGQTGCVFSSEFLVSAAASDVLLKGLM